MNKLIPVPAPAVLRTLDAAEYLSISRAHLYVLVERGELQKIRLGGKAAGFRKFDLDAWIDAQAED